jgi:hypothetical protein
MHARFRLHQKGYYTAYGYGRSPLSKSTWSWPCVHGYAEIRVDIRGQGHLLYFLRRSHSQFLNQTVVDPVVGRSGSLRAHRRCARLVYECVEVSAITCTDAIWDRRRERYLQYTGAGTETERVQRAYTWHKANDNAWIPSGL